jgi:hypothetical protein
VVTGVSVISIFVDVSMSPDSDSVRMTLGAYYAA